MAFLVLVSGTQEDAQAEKSALAEHLRQSTGLELSPEKTRVTAVTDGCEFLGFHVTMRWDERYGYGPRVEIPKAKAGDLRRKVKQLTGSNTTQVSLGEKLSRDQPHPARLGELLPLLPLRRPRVLQSRLVH
jgi:RNA-directed DNA polymerase